jgi:integrase
MPQSAPCASGQFHSPSVLPQICDYCVEPVQPFHTIISFLHVIRKLSASSSLFPAQIKEIVLCMLNILNRKSVIHIYVGMVANLGRYPLQQASLLKVRLHDSRHTHESLLLARSVHPKVVQERLGHSSITVTLDLYSQRQRPR